MAADTVDPGLHELRGEGLHGHQGDAVLWAGPGVDVEAQVQHVRTPACPQSCSWHPAPEQPRLPDRGFWGPGASRLCLWPSLHPPRDRPPSPQPQERDWLGRCWVNAVHKRGFRQLPRHESAVTNTRPCGGSKNPAVPTREAVRPASHVHLPHGAGTGAPRPIHRGKLPDGQGKRRLRAGRLPGGLRGVLAWEARSTSTGNLRGQQATPVLDTPQVPARPTGGGRARACEQRGKRVRCVGLGALAWAPAASRRGLTLYKNCTFLAGRGKRTRRTAARRRERTASALRHASDGPRWCSGPASHSSARLIRRQTAERLALLSPRGTAASRRRGAAPHMRDVSVKDTPKRDLLRPRLLSTPTPHASHFRCVARAFSLNERALGAHGASALPARGPRRNGAAQAAGVPGRGPGPITSFSLPDASLKSSEGPDPTGGVLGPEGTGPGLTRKKCARSAVSWTLASVSRWKTARCCWASRAGPRHRVLRAGWGG